MSPSTTAGQNRSVPWYAWVLLGLVVSALAALFPASGDDWRRIDFADRTVSGYVAEALSYYRSHNGRVVANTISYLLMEPAWLRVTVKGAAVVALVAALHRVTGGRTGWSPALLFVGVFLVPAPVFRESLGWTTGFFHYVPPVIGLVLLIGAIAGRWPGGSRSDTWGGFAMVAAVGLLTCLFIEHVTVAAVGVTVGGLGLALARGTRPSLALLGGAGGAVLGTTVMVLSPGLRRSLSGEDPYYARTGGWADTVVSNYATVTQSFVLSSPVLLGLVVLACVHGGVRVLRRGRTVSGPALLVGTGVVLLWALVSRSALSDRLVCQEPTVSGCDVRVLGADLLAHLLLLVLIVVIGAWDVAPGRPRTAWAGMMVGTVLMLGPLLLVQPIGPRNLFGPIVTLFAAGVIMLSPLLLGRTRLARAARWMVAVVLVLGLVRVAVVQSTNAEVARARVVAMETAVARQESSAVLPPFPYPEWVHGPDDTKMGHHFYVQDRGDVAISFSD